VVEYTLLKYAAQQCLGKVLNFEGVLALRPKPRER